MKPVFQMKHLTVCFRLLNSEIGNDHLAIRIKLQEVAGFRLLNSEIGNYQYGMSKQDLSDYCFRLLNSEIGNDPSNIKMASEWGLRP